LKPIASPGAFGLTTCVFPGCGGIAQTVRPGTQKLCGAHVSQKYLGKELQPVGYRLNDGFNANRTARTCQVCEVEKPVDEFYDRNKNLNRSSTSKAKKCKTCFKLDVAYYQGKRNTKADGSDPKNFQARPELQEQVREAHLEKNRARQRRYEEDKKNV
jgi:hypothetical protein